MDPLQSGFVSYFRSLEWSTGRPATGHAIRLDDAWRRSRPSQALRHAAGWRAETGLDRRPGGAVVQWSEAERQAVRRLLLT